MLSHMTIMMGVMSLQGNSQAEMNKKKHDPTIQRRNVMLTYKGKKNIRYYYFYRKTQRKICNITDLSNKKKIM